MNAQRIHAPLTLSVEPSAMACPMHSGNSEPLKPVPVIPQGLSHTPGPLIQKQDSYSHREQGLHSNPRKPPQPMERPVEFPEPAACLTEVGALLWQVESRCLYRVVA